MNNTAVLDSAYAAMVEQINKGVEYPDAEFRAALRVNRQSFKAISVDSAAAQLRALYDCETTSCGHILAHDEVCGHCGQPAQSGHAFDCAHWQTSPARFPRRNRGQAS